MQHLRTLSTRRLVGLAAALVVLVAGGVSIAQAALQSNPRPAPKALDVAVHDALSAPAVAGVTARVELTNHLIPSGALPEGTASPLIAGASGRLWATSDGRFRLELQSQAGDAQLVSDGKVVTLYDASSNTVYRFTLPQPTAAEQQRRQADPHVPPTLAKIEQAIADIGKHWTVSGAIPTSTAGEPTYTVRIAPRDDGGLLGAVELAWDADNGIPLRIGVYARGQADPVLELRVTRVSFGAVATGDVAATPPADAKVVDLSTRKPDSAGLATPNDHGTAKPVTGVDAVQARLPFPLVAPDRLAGLPRSGVRLVGHGSEPAAVSVYGTGLGAIVVLERKAKPGEQMLGSGAGESSRHSLQLPQLTIDGAPGHELATALGTVVSFQRGGVDYVVAGSVAAASAETAARQLG
jgi:hypothetical protein